MSQGKVSCRFAVRLKTKHLRDLYCFFRDQMSQREQEPFCQRESHLVKLVHVSDVSDACVKLVLLLLLQKPALSKPFSGDVLFSNGLSSTSFKKSWFLRFQGQGNSCWLLASLVQMEHNTWEELLPQGAWPRCRRYIWSVVKIFYIIINHFLASWKCNMLNIFILNVKS